MLMCLCCGVSAQAGDEIVFTTILENPITPVKNQSRSGTCWSYATIGFIEAELLRTTGKVYDLSEMFVASKDYVDCAEYHVRMHGCSRFSEGGSADDVFEVINRHGICPEQAMARPGSMIGDTLANFTEFFATLEPYVESIAKGNSTKLTSQWKVGLQGILDAYLGKCPDQFTYEGKQYTPQSFAKSLGINKNDYVSITSFTHHPFYEQFVIEAPYKWRPRPSWNVTLDEMMATIDEALKQGYTVCWGGDVSEDGFTRTGLGIAADIEHADERSVAQMLKNENGRNFSHTRMQDLDVCHLIDSDLLRGYGVSSVYQLTGSQRQQLARQLFYDYRLPEQQVRRCLVLA